MKTILVTLVLLFSLSTVNAQLDKANKKLLKKGEKAYKKEKYQEACGYYEKVLKNYPIFPPLWKKYQEARGILYSQSDALGNISISVETEDDSLAQALTAMFANFKDVPKHNFFNSVVDATLYCPGMASSSTMARSYYIDSRYWSDTMMTEKGSAYYTKAEGEFKAKNYEKAITYYEKAIALDSSNYKALLYIGDSYYAMEYYGKAAKYFRQATAMQPNLLEPHIYLIDALMNKGEEEETLVALKDALKVYPGEGIYSRIEGYADETAEIEFNRNWIIRTAKVNQILDMNFRKKFFEDPYHFREYTLAMEEVRESYDEKGIRKADASEDLEMYLEAYCWRRMLEETEDDEIESLEYAREMEDKGMLTAYVLINMCNVDLYDQYRHYIDNNEAFVDKYIDTYLIPAVE